MRVNNKVFVITGAGGGIGGEIVLELLSRGASVAGVDLREDGLKDIKQKAGETSGKFTYHPLDITDKKSVSELPEKVIRDHGSVDGVINNAGIIQPFVKVNDLDYDAIERVMNVNFYGMLYMTKAFLPYLLKRPEAYITNVSSMGGFLPVPGQSVYGASKAGVKLFTEGLYAELLDTPVHVSVVFPGATNTNITKNSKVDAPKVASADADKLASNMLTANQVAKIIINGIEKNKPQIYTGKDSKFMNKLYRANPVFATKFIAKKMKSLLS